MPLPRALAAVIQPVTRQALGRRQAGIGALLADWPAIAGARWSLAALPQKLAYPPGRREGGTLQLRVEPADALELQHDSALLLERVNGHFGYRAVDRLILLQAPVRRRRPATPAKALDAQDLAAIDRVVESVTDQVLRTRLQELGRALWRRNGAG